MILAVEALEAFWQMNQVARHMEKIKTGPEILPELLLVVARRLLGVVKVLLTLLELEMALKFF